VNGSCRVGMLAAAVISTTACLSTNIDDASDLPVCAATAPAAGIEDAIVKIELDAPPNEICNGVAIAPTLLLTAVNCVTLLASDSDDAGFLPPRCADTGAPIEDGSFLFRFSMMAAPSLVLVSDADGVPFESAVARIFVSNAVSVCMPDLAVLEMQIPLDVPVVPVRFEEKARVEDEVLLVGFDFSESPFGRHASSATISELTSDRGTETLPPRSFSLSGNACTLPGGAVLDPGTGALVGSIRSTERTVNCPSEQGSPIAVRLPPFRQFLMETARTASTSLVVEPPLGVAGTIAPCRVGG
jgi:hypothetical protein